MGLKLNKFNAIQLRKKFPSCIGFIGLALLMGLTLNSVQCNPMKKIFPSCIGFIGLDLLMGLTLNSVQCNPMKKKISIVHWIHWISFTNGAYTQLSSMQFNEKKIFHRALDSLD